MNNQRAVYLSCVARVDMPERLPECWKWTELGLLRKR